jgi:ATP-dependent helicase HrpB
LWTEKEQAALAAHRPPEILETDLAPLTLDLAQWGTLDPEELSWLTPPPRGGISQSKELLVRLGAFSTDGRLTQHGRQMAALPLHPRLSHMMIQSRRPGLTDLACEVAALLSERDILPGVGQYQDPDLRIRLDLIHGQHNSVGLPVNRATVERVKRTAQLWRRQLNAPSVRGNGYGHDRSQAVGVLLALAYPDRIAQRQTGEDARYRLVNGRGARFTGPNSLAAEPFLVIADLDGGTPWARINLAAPITIEEIESLYRDQIVVEESVTWDKASGAVRASRRQKLGAVVTTDEAISEPDKVHILKAILHGIHQAGLESLSFTNELQKWRARVMWVRHIEGPHSDWPDLSNEALLTTLGTWLSPYLAGITTLDRVKRLDLTPPLHGLLTYEQHRRLDQLAPTHLAVPSGSRLRIDYEQPELPVLAVRLQEMFGCKETPRVANGKIPVMLHLLSPAGRPVQVTQDLAGFWKRAYHEVRKELRGRYPKHQWPEDPLNSIPTAKPKRRS